MSILSLCAKRAIPDGKGLSMGFGQAWQCPDLGISGVGGSAPFDNNDRDGDLV